VAIVIIIIMHGFQDDRSLETRLQCRRLLINQIKSVQFRQRGPQQLVRQITQSHTTRKEKINRNDDW